MSRADRVSVVILFAVMFCLFAVLPFAAHAATNGIPKQIVPEECKNPSGCGCAQLVQLAQNILGTGIYIAVVLSAVLFAWAGLKYLTNAANPEQKSQAKEVIRNVVIGLVIILASWLVVDTLLKTLQVNLKGAGVWNSICGNT